MYKIYCATNIINDKKYIGFTSKNLEQRIKEHYYDILYEKSKHFPFKKALAKYKKEEFKWEILFESEDKDVALNKEAELIKYYKTQQLEFGYNVQSGGKVERLGVYHSDESKQKMSESAKLRGNNKPPNPIIVINLITGEKFKFDYISHAAKALGLNRRALNNVLCGWASKTGNYTAKRL